MRAVARTTTYLANSSRNCKLCSDVRAHPSGRGHLRIGLTGRSEGFFRSEGISLALRFTPGFLL